MLKAFTFLSLGAVTLVAAANEAQMTRVFDYCPAPGQFVNVLPEYAPGDTRATMAQKAQELLCGDTDGSGMVTLGAYGGYIVIGWDHPVVNVAGEYDFRVLGNAHSNGSEAGIVLVSRDVNGNGLPDDPWYELAGSEYAKTETMHTFEVKYQRPEALDKAYDTKWTSNDPADAEGVVKANTFHQQPYWPQWVDETELAFQGTRLAPYAVMEGAVYTLPAFEWGYADNVPNVDDQGMKIDWAVDAQGKAVTLPSIDFVKIYTGSLQNCGPIGEVSTEVCGAEDLHPEAVPTVAEGLAVATFDDLGLPLNSTWYHGEYDENDEDVISVDGSFTSGGYTFNNIYMPEYDSWSFWAASTMQSSQFTSYVTDQWNSAAGGGRDSEGFGVFFDAAYMGVNEVRTADGEPHVIPGTYVTNAAWDVDAIVNGDGMTEGGFAQGDWLKLTALGVRGDETLTDGVDFYLADYRSADASDHYYIKDWHYMPLAALGEVKAVRFSISSSRNNSWGMTSPGYACFDDFGAEDDGSGLSLPTASENDTFSVARAGQIVTATCTLGAFSAALYDMSGALCHEARANQGALSIDVSALPAGCYLLRLQSATNATTVKIMI